MTSGFSDQRCSWNEPRCALKRLESAARKILREGVLAADLPPYNAALRDQALDGAVYPVPILRSPGLPCFHSTVQTYAFIWITCLLKACYNLFSVNP